MSVPQATGVVRRQWEQRTTSFAPDNRRDPIAPTVGRDDDTEEGRRGLSPGVLPRRMRVPARPRSGMRFNVPPGWPPAPNADALATGFLPDPAWPVAPLGWQFWTEQSASTPDAAEILGAVIGAVVAPVGIAWGYAVRKQAYAEGRDPSGAERAIKFGFVGAAVWTIVGIVVLWSAIIDNPSDPFSSAGQYEYSETETTTTTPPGYVYDAANPIEETIRTSDVGACLYEQSSGGRITYLDRVECSSGQANYIVTSRTDDTDYCSNSWVRAPSTYDNDYTVVLCLDSY